MLNCTNYNNKAYKRLCKCGYQSKPFLIIHGRYENWKDSRTLNYFGAEGTKLDDIMQITKDEFELYKSSFESYGCVSQTGLTWTDDDGDGYGWVFCGGVVLKSSGVEGTIESIVGSEGDYGKKEPFDEVYILARYINSISTPIRTGFVEYLKNRINSTGNPTRHMLYGYDDKYQNKVTDEQFDLLIKEFKGYTTHTSGWGWSGMSIIKGTHNANGHQIYTTYQSFIKSQCYDSSNNHYSSYSDGIKTDCDLCGAHFTGNENYEADTYYRCSRARNLTEGQTVKCSGHSVYGREYMGMVYDTWTKKNGKYYRVKVEAVPADGYTATITGCGENKEIPQTSGTWGNSWTYVGTVKFSNETTSRTINCGFNYSMVDEDPPVIDTITMTPQTYSGNWATISQLDVSGTENYCNMVHLSVSNKSSGKTIIDKAAVTVTDNKYSYMATPPLEGSETGTVYTLTVQDLYGNTSTKDFTVYNTDGTAPQVESPLSYTDWTAKAKTITLTIADYGSGGVQTSLGDQTHYQECTKTADGKYQITYTFSDDIIGTKNYDLYLKDTLGNATKVTLAVGNIDKNKYTITYDLDGGTATGLKTTYTVEDTFMLPQVSKNGYIFTGYSGSNGSTPQTKVTVNKGTRGNLSYTANWTPIHFTVKYDANGGTGTMADSSHVYKGGSKLSKCSFLRSGFSFTGWKYSKILNGKMVWLYTDSNGNYADGGLWYEDGKNPSGTRIAVGYDGVGFHAQTFVDGDVITAHAQWTYDTISVKVPQILISDKSGDNSFRVRCDDIEAGNIKVDVLSSFSYKQTGKVDVVAVITQKSGSNIITPSNKSIVYNISTNGLSAGSWSGSFNISLTLTKE